MKPCPHPVLCIQALSRSPLPKHPCLLPVRSASCQCHHLCLQLTNDQRSAPPDDSTQHSTAQHSTAQHSTAQHSTAQHSTAQHSTAQNRGAEAHTAQQGRCQQSTQEAWMNPSSTQMHHGTEVHAQQGTSTAHTGTLNGLLREAICQQV
jgi:hypothetical protein